jgi:taurine dioxygenase
MTIHTDPIASALGAEVSGANLTAGLSNAEASAVHDAFLRHKVLVFRDQPLTPDALLRLARVFGEPDVYPFIEGLPDFPEIIEILKTEFDRINFGGSWHSDTAYLEQPSLGSLLHAVEVPDCGGDTLFTNTELAFQALSPGLKEALAPLRAVNSSEGRYPGGRAAAMARLDGMKNSYREASQVYESVHPVVRIHPETGARSLYLSTTHIRRFEGMTDAESAGLIEYLCRHLSRPEFTCRIAWRPGTTAVWDNRCTQHHAVNDYHGERRRMRRVTLKGDRPSGARSAA